MRDRLPKDWDFKSLGELGTFIRGVTYKKDMLISSSNPDAIRILRSNNIQKKADLTELKYLPKSAIKEHQIIQNNDILLCMSNGSKKLVGKNVLIKSLPKSSFGAFCSVFRSNKFINPLFISYYLASDNFKNAILKFSKGSGILNLKNSQLETLTIPLPPLQEQQKIVNVLDATLSKIDQAIALVNQNIEKLEQLNASVLDELFINLKNEKQELLVEIAEVKRGKSKHRPRNDKSLYGGKYPLIQTGDVRRTGKYVTEFSKTYNEIGLAQSKLWKKGTICLTIAANIGEVAILGIDACFPDSVLGIYSEEQNNDYIYYFLKSIQQKLDKKSSAAAQKNLSVSKLSDELIPIPTIKKQKKIVKYLDHTTEKNNQLIQHYKNKLQALQDLKKSVLDSAFKGKLKREVVKVEAAFSLPFYQMQLIGLSIQANKQDNIPQGEMAIAKDMYLLDRLYGVDTKMKFVNHSWGPFAPEIKKRVTNKQYFGRKNFPNSKATYLDTINDELLLGKVGSSIRQQVFKGIQDLNEKLFLKVSKYDRAKTKELLATVLKCIEDKQTIELSAIRRAMQDWEIEQGQYKTKAEKFTEADTVKMLQFITKNEWSSKVLKEN